MHLACWRCRIAAAVGRDSEKQPSSAPLSWLLSLGYNQKKPLAGDEGAHLVDGLDKSSLPYGPHRSTIPDRGWRVLAASVWPPGLCRLPGVRWQ